MPALRAGGLPWGHRLGARVGRLHRRVLQGRPRGSALLRLRAKGASVLRQSPCLHLQVSAGKPRLYSMRSVALSRCCLPPSATADVDRCRCRHRPSCYNCGEGGHTADECRRERPPVVRNEQQPAPNQSAWDYGRGHGSGGADGYRGARAYGGGNTARCAASGHFMSKEQAAPCSAM